jgi:hypothetical protein
MTVREVIGKCEELLEVKSTKEDLLECFNLVENELAQVYLPLYATHYCDANVVKYSDFEYRPIRIVSCNCKFKLYPDYIESQDTITEINYAYTPNNKGLYDECSYNDTCEKCLTYGVIAEYLLSQGFYEEADVWNRKYKKEIELLRL